MRKAFALVLALAALFAAVAEANVPCNKGFIEFECPDDYPMCCAWPENNVQAACCPLGSRCDLDAGRCVTDINSRNRTSNDPKAQNGITVGVSEAAAFITFAAIGFIVALVGCAFLAFKVYVSCERRRQRRQEEERRRLMSESDESGADAADDGDSEVDDEGMCNICYARSVNCALMPCAHVCTCRGCAQRLDKCPICRKEVMRAIPFKNRLFAAVEPAARARKDASARRAGSTAATEELAATGSAPGSSRQEAVSNGAAAPSDPAAGGDSDERPAESTVVNVPAAQAVDGGATPQPENGGADEAATVEAVGHINGNAEPPATTEPADAESPSSDATDEVAGATSS